MAVFIENSTGVTMNIAQVDAIGQWCNKRNVNYVVAVCQGFANEPKMFDLHSKGQVQYLFSVHENGDASEF